MYVGEITLNTMVKGRYGGVGSALKKSPFGDRGGCEFYVFRLTVVAWTASRGGGSRSGARPSNALDHPPLPLM